MVLGYCDAGLSELKCAIAFLPISFVASFPTAVPLKGDVTVFQHTIHIPALCKLNPVYDELVNLRLRALIYLTDVCDADITPYIR